jgi:hypothetical protein
MPALRLWLRLTEAPYGWIRKPRVILRCRALRQYSGVAKGAALLCSGLRNAVAKGKRLGRPRKVVDTSRIATLRDSGRSWRNVADEIGVWERSVRRLALRCGKNPIAADSASRFPSAAD